MAQSKYYNTGGGVLYFRPLIDGVLGIESEFGGTENVSFSSEVETLTHDNTEGAVTVEDLSILKKITGKLTIETVEVSPEMLIKAFLGTDESVAVIANATGTTPSLGFVTNVLHGETYPIGVKHLDDATIVVKDDTDVTTYVLDTDYTLSRMGDTTYITFIGATIITGDILHIIADNSAYSDIRVEGFMESKLEGQLRFVSDVANGVAYTYVFHKVSLLASGDFMLKSTEEFSKLSFEGSMLASELITANDESKLFVITGTELT